MVSIVPLPENFVTSNVPCSMNDCSQPAIIRLNYRREDSWDGVSFCAEHRMQVFLAFGILEQALCRVEEEQGPQ